MSEEKNGDYTERVLIKHDDCPSSYFNLKIEKCLEEIKKDLRHLPCQGRVQDCLQHEPIEDIKLDVKNINEAATILRQDQKLINQKQDIQQTTLDRIEKNIMDHNKIAGKEFENLKINVNTLKSVQAVEEDNKRLVREKIAWGLGLIGTLVILYNFFQGVLF